MDDSAPRRSRLRGWWGIGASVLAMLVITLVLAWWWYVSTGDLDAVHADAKALGIPTTWAEARLVMPPADELALYEHVGKLSESLKDYDSGVMLLGKAASKELRLQPFLPIPPAALDHHAKLNAEQVADLLVSLDRLPHHPLILRNERPNGTKLPEIGWQRGLTRLLGERVLLAPRDRLVAENRRLLHLSELHDPRALIDLLVHLSMLEMALNSCAGRFAELKTDDPELPDLLDRLADHLDESLIQTTTGEFIICNHNVTHVDDLKGSIGPDSPWSETMIGPVVRASRESILRALIDWVEMSRKHLTPSQLVVFAKNLEHDIQLLSTWRPSDWLLRMFAPVVSIILKQTANCQARLRFMAAELRGQPWPIDPFDPTGKTLRHFERDGLLLGGYTVHEDGVDNGGDKRKDRYFPLYGPLEPPMPVAGPTTP